MSHVPMPRVENHPSLDQKVVNPRTGKLECVAVNLEAVYPDPQDPSIEFCFEELRAAKHGWLQRDWRRATSPRRAASPQWISPEKKQRSPLKESPHKQLKARPDDFDDGAVKGNAPQVVRLNDENDENAPPQTASPGFKHTSGRKKQKDDDNKTRKIKVRELKSETQTSEISPHSSR